MEYLIEGLEGMEISPSCDHVGCPSICQCIQPGGVFCGLLGGCVGIYQCDQLGDCIFR